MESEESIVQPPMEFEELRAESPMRFELEPTIQRSPSPQDVPFSEPVMLPSWIPDASREYAQTPAASREYAQRETETKETLLRLLQKGDQIAKIVESIPESFVKPPYIGVLGAVIQKHEMLSLLPTVWLSDEQQTCTPC